MGDRSPRWVNPTRKAGQRKCLKCDVKFISVSKYHRLCNFCRGINRYIADIEIEIPRKLWKKLAFQHYHAGG